MLYISKYGSTLYIGIAMVVFHYTMYMYIVAIQTEISLCTLFVILYLTAKVMDDGEKRL